MQLCDECVARHNSNSVLSAHQLIAVNDTRAVLAMFCTKHREQPIRYFCAECHVTLCSICAVEHDPAHKPELLEQGVLEKYRFVLLSSSLLTADALCHCHRQCACVLQLLQKH